MQNIGLFGGTFNPIHAGHLHAAEEVRKRFPLEQIILIPSALPPHKLPDNLAEAQDRLEMLRLASTGISYLSISDVELNRGGPSYTIDTVFHFKSRVSRDHRLFWIVGIDAFLEIETWKAYRSLFEQIAFIVMSRPDRGNRQNVAAERKQLETYLINTLSGDYVFAASKNAFLHPELKPVYFIDIEPLAVSSTDIRMRARQGETILNLVPESVQQYIKSKGLYL